MISFSNASILFPYLSRSHAGLDRVKFKDSLKVLA